MIVFLVVVLGGRPVVLAVMQAAKQTSAQSEGFRRRREKHAPFKGCAFFPLGAISNLEKRKKANGQGRAFPVQTHLVYMLLSLY